MKLLNTNEVCELLGISKSTLYRWNNIIDDDDSVFENYPKDSMNKPTIVTMVMTRRKTTVLCNSLNNEEQPKNFPRPFKIGQSYAWRNDEIENWLETVRI